MDRDGEGQYRAKRSITNEAHGAVTFTTAGTWPTADKLVVLGSVIAHD